MLIIIYNLDNNNDHLFHHIGSVGLLVLNEYWLVLHYNQCTDGVSQYWIFRHFWHFCMKPRGNLPPSLNLKKRDFLCFCTQDFVFFIFCPPLGSRSKCYPPPWKNWNDVPAWCTVAWVAWDNYVHMICRLIRLL